MKSAIYGAGSLGTVLGAYITKNVVENGKYKCEFKNVKLFN